MPSTSKVAKASTNSKSIRTTIPEDIAEELKINVGDLLIWTVVERKGKLIASIQKWEG